MLMFPFVLAAGNIVCVEQYLPLYYDMIGPFVNIVQHIGAFAIVMYPTDKCFVYIDGSKINYDFIPEGVFVYGMVNGEYYCISKSGKEKCD